jgi:hypothetical protein
MSQPIYDENGTLIPPAFGRTQVPAAYAPVGVPAGATVHVRARPGGPPPTLTVEDATGEDLLTLTVTPDGRLDALYDETRLTEAAQRFLLEVRHILGLTTTTNDPTIRIATNPTPPPPPRP